MRHTFEAYPGRTYVWGKSGCITRLKEKSNMLQNPSPYYIVSFQEAIQEEIKFRCRNKGNIISNRISILTGETRE